MNNFSRRDFFKIAAGTAAVFVTAKILTPQQALAQQKPLPMLNPADSTAKAVKYVEDAKKAPLAKGNDCANCSFYAKKETRSGKEAGTCIIFSGKLVYGAGYCNSWNKKPA